MLDKPEVLRCSLARRIVEVKKRCEYDMGARLQSPFSHVSCVDMVVKKMRIFLVLTRLVVCKVSLVLMSLGNHLVDTSECFLDNLLAE
jgi:hypothetical protein